MLKKNEMKINIPDENEEVKEVARPNPFPRFTAPPPFKPDSELIPSSNQLRYPPYAYSRKHNWEEQKIDNPYQYSVYLGCKGTDDYQFNVIPPDPHPTVPDTILRIFPTYQNSQGEKGELIYFRRGRATYYAFVADPTTIQTLREGGRYYLGILPVIAVPPEGKKERTVVHLKDILGYRCFCCERSAIDMSQYVSCIYVEKNMNKPYYREPDFFYNHYVNNYRPPEQVQRKYYLTGETKRTTDDRVLRRIRAARDIPEIGVKKGDLGGFIEKDWNLSHAGTCWIHSYDYGDGELEGEAMVYGSARVIEDAQIYDHSKVFGSALVSGHAALFDYACVFDYTRVFDDAKIAKYAQIYGKSQVFGSATVTGFSKVHGEAIILDSSVVTDSHVSFYADIRGASYVKDKMLSSGIYVDSWNNDYINHSI